jgi:hypothetical protein
VQGRLFSPAVPAAKFRQLLSARAVPASQAGDPARHQPMIAWGPSADISLERSNVG